MALPAHFEEYSNAPDVSFSPSAPFPWNPLHIGEAMGMVGQYELDHNLTPPPTLMPMELDPSLEYRLNDSHLMVIERNRLYDFLELVKRPYYVIGFLPESQPRLLFNYQEFVNHLSPLYADNFALADNTPAFSVDDVLLLATKLAHTTSAVHGSLIQDKPTSPLNDDYVNLSLLETFLEFSGLPEMQAVDGNAGINCGIKSSLHGPEKNKYSPKNHQIEGPREQLMNPTDRIVAVAKLDVRQFLKFLKVTNVPDYHQCTRPNIDQGRPIRFNDIYGLLFKMYFPVEAREFLERSKAPRPGLKSRSSTEPKWVSVTDLVEIFRGITDSAHGQVEQRPAVDLRLIDEYLQENLSFPLAISTEVPVNPTMRVYTGPYISNA
ncbi:hypothetical protein IWQ60_012296 [Tieghemiomyces parasiticus]|uniref:Uncharacterized protein n=1 Tax=Tieghemiomyces parasiticus TaxID=78921 RepID=A0A9W7ZFJ2_9FUNG|nr:hypothetical protein IWQ60_012296 [Tieghemiomyces parasiticus]